MGSIRNELKCTAVCSTFIVFLKLTHSTCGVIFFEVQNNYTVRLYIPSATSKNSILVGEIQGQVKGF